MLKLDKWQQEVLKTQGNIVLRSGRQVGKSFIIGIKAAEYALENQNKLIMIISKTERQAGLLFSKVLFNISQKDRKQIKTGVDKPTKHKITLKNGTIIYSLPAGDTGFGIMGFTIDLLIADEAAFIPEEVWNSIVPALSVTRGALWLLSTPFLSEGYYYNCFSDPTFTAFHTSSEDCPRRDDVFLARQRTILTKAQYAQMYLGEFVDDLLRLFSDDLINKCCILKRRKPTSKGNHYLGCDVARSKDQFTYEVLDKISDTRIEQIESIETIDVPIPESTRKIIEMDKEYHFIKEFIDSGGMGITVCDLLREDDENKNKVVEINNASRPYDRDERKKKILKEDLYFNLKALMENGIIKLLDDDELKASFRSILKDYSKDTGRLRIWGNDSHHCEGVIRAAQCSKDKNLGIWVTYI